MLDDGIYTYDINILGLAAAFESGGSSIQGSLNTVVIGNFAVNLILYVLFIIIIINRSSSLNFLWGMINAL
jgi:hypothetical protein